jgi:hypothetical protein
MKWQFLSSLNKLICICLTVLIILCTYFFYFNLCYDFLRIENVLLFVCICLALIIAIIFYFFVKPLRFWPLFYILAILPLPFLANGFINWQQQRSFQDAKVIIAALDRYYATHPYWPKNLEQLQPQYLENIPLQQFGLANAYPFSYYLGNDSNYIFSINKIGSFNNYYLDRELQKWYAHD